MFLADVLAAVECDARGDVIDWRGLRVASYDATSLTLEYATPRAIVVNAANAAGVEMVEIAQTRAHNAVSIACTTNHMLYVQPTKAAAGESSSSTQYVKMRADDVVRTASSFRLMARARAGVGQSSSSAHAIDYDGDMQCVAFAQPLNVTRHNVRFDLCVCVCVCVCVCLRVSSNHVGACVHRFVGILVWLECERRECRRDSLCQRARSRRRVCAMGAAALRCCAHEH
jgi:hypothetical protein